MCYLSVDTQEVEYKLKARESWDIAWNMLCSSDWKRVTGETLETGIISCMHRGGRFGKVFMVEVSAPLTSLALLTLVKQKLHSEGDADRVSCVRLIIPFLYK